jgi:16S rRNA (guanine527-N7)-methyltransferase
VVTDRRHAPGALSPYLDLGTGAGFPGLPLAVALPGLETTLLDSRGKKVEFLRRALGLLGLDRVRALKARGRELRRLEPETAASYRLVTARAVGEVAAVLSEVRGLVRPGGRVVIPKGPSLTEEELQRGAAAGRRFGFHLEQTLKLEVEGLTPRIVLFRREPSTPAS